MAEINAAYEQIKNPDRAQSNHGTSQQSSYGGYSSGSYGGNQYYGGERDVNDCFVPGQPFLPLDMRANPGIHNR